MPQPVQIVVDKRKKLVKGLIEVTDDAIQLGATDTASLLHSSMTVEFANLSNRMNDDITKLHEAD